MPIAIGRFESIVAEKSGSISETFLGKAARGALTGLLAHALAAGVQSETAAPAWKPLGVKWGPDPTWGANFGKSPTRMAADDKGNLYVSDGDYLHMGSPSGETWKKAPIIHETVEWRNTPVILGAEGRVLWGAWTSGDRGKTWKTVPDEVSSHDYLAAAIAPAGYCLFGTSLDRISRAAGLGDAIEGMHFGSTFGSIVDIAIASSGKAYAAPEADDLLVSRDSGKTWVERKTLLKSDPAARDDVLRPSGLHAPGLLALEAAYPEETLWMVSGRWNGKKQVVEFGWAGDSLVARYHANLKAPDSTVTAFRLQQPAAGPVVLWMGTWGQGVFRSTDRGETWETVNAGLEDLHIEALVVGSEGRLFALNEFGLYTISGAALGIRPVRASRANRRATGNPGARIRFEGPAGGLFRLDGRADGTRIEGNRSVR